MRKPRYNGLMAAQIRVPRDMIERFAKKHGIARLSFFGSVLSTDFRPDSDVDVLVEFEPGKVPGYLRLVEIEEDLATLVGRRIDLVTAKALNHRIRDQVLREAEVQYAEG